MTGEPTFTCPITVDGHRCSAKIPAKHWVCRKCWLLMPAPFRCNANRYRRGTEEYDAMIRRANTLLAKDYTDLEPPWRR